MVKYQTSMWLLLFHSPFSEHEEDADQQSLQGECEKRTQPSAETSFQPKCQCSGKHAWLACMISPRESQLAVAPVVSLGAEHQDFSMESRHRWHPLWSLKIQGPLQSFCHFI